MTIITSGVWPIDANVETGTMLATHLNELVLAINSAQASPSRPPMITKGGIWAKTAGATDISIMFYDGTTDHVIGSVVGGVAKFGGATFNSGATATKPTTPSKGDMFWDTTLSQLEIYDGGAWVDTTNNRFYTANDTTGVLSIKSGTTPTEAISVLADGKVGIGNTTPTAKLHIQQTSAGASVNQLILQNADNSTGTGSAMGFSNHSSNGLLTGKIENAIDGTNAYSLRLYSFQGGLTERMRIAADGNVGIGTDAPGTFVQIRKDQASGTELTVTNALNDATALAALVLSNDASQARIELESTVAGKKLNIMNNTGGDTTFYTGSAERVRIDANGNVGFGDTAPSARIGIKPSIDGSNLCIRSNPGTAGVPYKFAIFNNASTTSGEIIIGTSSTTYSTASDYRLKKNITPMTGALNKVSQLNPVTFKWKSDNSATQGFIAHELQAVVPECVTGEKDAVDADGNPVYQGIDTSFLVATLTAAIQEQQTIITDLTARIAKLEGTSKTVVR